METNCATGILSLSIGLFSFAIHKQLSNGLQYPDFTAPRKKPFQIGVQAWIIDSTKNGQKSSKLGFLGLRGPLRTPSFVRLFFRLRQKSKSHLKAYTSSQDHARPLI